MPVAFPTAASLTLYKDFHKDVNDMLTKSYSESEKWKVESKFKGPKDTLFVNPTATSDGKFSVDVEYAPSQCGAAVKATLQPYVRSAGLTVSYRYRGHKVEAVVRKCCDY
ncbi:voltage-dependent anion-selective channel, partial [Trypanosoma conorhini]